MMDEEEQGWSFWGHLGLACMGYSSSTDEDLINVFILTNGKHHFYTEIAAKLQLDSRYVALLMELLCSADFCEYGTSPRGAWAIHATYEANLERLKEWFFREWGEPFEPHIAAQSTKEQG